MLNMASSSVDHLGIVHMSIDIRVSLRVLVDLNSLLLWWLWSWSILSISLLFLASVQEVSNPVH